MEKTLLIIKPDAVERKLIGSIIQRIEKKGLVIKALKMEKITLEKAEKHYKIHKGKDFYNDLIEFIISGPVVLVVIEGENCIQIVRHMAGSTSPIEAAPGTIRGDYSIDTLKNIVHTSDSIESSTREINNFFNM
ncbi:nucleoside-diphosphate kinase [Cetobacterium sp. 8H]|uniref:nucleoside-diphosphate kinase n=1 Tax=Cetobacterium sp. 8H TaxID=2759681 RepID=UPI00163C868B|nr:nucleoside-diphosphate kinase [Cetobacterium sp. 8H]MBC2852083.1 nucleoside-diphosphate kinase [Cetobacterium sp. 8H]